VYKAGGMAIQNRGWAMAVLPQLSGDGDRAQLDCQAPVPARRRLTLAI
jgi:hypothetical protein